MSLRTTTISERIDIASEDSFPASDPPAWTLGCDISDEPESAECSDECEVSNKEVTDTHQPEQLPLPLEYTYTASPNYHRRPPEDHHQQTV